MLAAWALYVLQENSLASAEIPPVWERVLQDTDDLHPAIVSQAVRGLGATRDAKYASIVEPFLHHPTARVRFNATIAIGRMKAQECSEALIELLGPSETVQNVRLGARKALQALAGGVEDVDGHEVRLLVLLLLGLLVAVLGNLGGAGEDEGRGQEGRHLHPLSPLHSRFTAPRGTEPPGGPAYQRGRLHLWFGIWPPPWGYTSGT